MDKQTSDERLLKLIESGSGVKHPQVITPGLRKVPLSHTALKFKLLELKTKIKSFKISLFFLNKGLIALAILLTVIFLYTIFSGSIISKSSTFFSPVDASAIMKLISAGKAQGLIRKNISSQDIQRNFFLPFGTKSSVYSQEEGPDLTEEVKALRLVGIIWSKNPEVMIENAKDSRTYTFKKGDSFDGNFRIKDISRNAAVLEVTTDSGIKEYVLR